ncbi:pentatricopeptide repeat-containing protein [Tanacetum coccineum]
MIMGYAMQGFGNEELDVFRKMCETDVTPDESKYKIAPTVEHYTCVIDMLGRAGLLKEAYGLVSEMPIEANSVMQGAFLAACRVNGNGNFAEIAVRKVVELEQEHCGSSVLMSNVYGAMGRYEEVFDVRFNTRQQNVKKTLGCSWIKFRDGVHVYGTGDREHSAEELIYNDLRSLYMTMGLSQTSS